MPSLFWKRDGRGGVIASAADDVKAAIEARDAAYWIVQEIKITQAEYDKLSLSDLTALYPYIHRRKEA